MAVGLFRKIAEKARQALEYVKRYAAPVYQFIRDTYEKTKPILEFTPIAPSLPLIETGKNWLDKVFGQEKKEVDKSADGIIPLPKFLQGKDKGSKQFKSPLLKLKSD